ncbi:hypothetical protein H0H81_002191 [Sphagnurus paluster]|uniref:Uncharacterized protein n=1 Tax=Sphagnurus paluster TaxID=117069 RepID=A0A9P7GLZ8_9AGAR|nr:hypothetical protein H0H81_002191 [Sphagnurus paluster]
MGNKKNKRKASSPAESTRPAPSRPVSPVYQAANRCDTPDQGYLDFQYAMEHCGDDSSSELNQPQEEAPPIHPIGDLIEDMLANLDRCLVYCKLTGTSPPPTTLPTLLQKIIDFWASTKSNDLLGHQLKANTHIRKLVDKSVSEALAKATPPPPPPPTMEVDSPSTPKAPGPPGATPPPRGTPTPPAPSTGAPASATPPLAAPAPRGKPAPLRNPPATRAPKHAPPPPPSQPAPKPTYAAALGSKAPRPRKAHPPTKLVAPASTKWVVIPTNKSQLRDAAKRPSPLHIVGAINRELHAWAGESIGGVQIANLGDSHLLAASWTVGCNLLITAAKARDCHGLDTPAYSTIVANALSTIPAFSNAGATTIPYRPAARLQIKGLPTWDPAANRPVELTSVYQTLDGLGLFEGVELIKNGPAPSDALSWARDPSTFNAESRPCAVTVRFYNNNGRETGALLKKAFYLLGRRRRFDKWQPRPPPPKKG